MAEHLASLCWPRFQSNAADEASSFPLSGKCCKFASRPRSNLQDKIWFDTTHILKLNPCIYLHTWILKISPPCIFVASHPDLLLLIVADDERFVSTKNFDVGIDVHHKVSKLVLPWWLINSLTLNYVDKVNLLVANRKRYFVILLFVSVWHKICCCKVTLFAKINSCNLGNCVLRGGQSFKVIYDMAPAQQ